MSIYKTSIVPSTSYPAVGSPNLQIPFEPKKITFYANSDTVTDIANISSDGVDDHITLTPTRLQQYESVQRCKDWYVRGVNSVPVIVIAES